MKIHTRQDMLTDAVINNLEVFPRDLKQMRDSIKASMNYFTVIAHTIPNPVEAVRLLAELGLAINNLDKLMSADAIVFSKEK